MRARRRQVSRLLALTALLALATLPRVAHAQASPAVAGNWVAEFVRGVRVVDGQEEAAEKGHAKITFTQKGDSVLGTWQTIVDAGQPASKPRQLRGVVANGKVTLVSEPSEVTLNTNGSESKMQVTTAYEFAVSGDAIVGTLTVTGADGQKLMDAKPFSATREKKS